MTRLRHYGNLSRTEARLRRLLEDFRFWTLGSLIENMGVPQAHAVSSTPVLSEAIAG